MDYNAFKQKCKERGYTATGLAKKIGLSKSNVTNWKNGGNPSIESIIKISEILDCSIGYLLGVEDDEYGYGVAVSSELRKNQATSARTISFKSSGKLEDKYLKEISAFANSGILFLCGKEKNFVPLDPNRKSAEISEEGWDKLLEIFDNVNDVPIIKNIQMQLCIIILYNLRITSAKQISDEFLSSKADFILNDKIDKDELRNYPFNISDLITLGDLFDKSIRFMISGIER